MIDHEYVGGVLDTIHNHIDSITNEMFELRKEITDDWASVGENPEIEDELYFLEFSSGLLSAYVDKLSVVCKVKALDK